VKALAHIAHEGNDLRTIDEMLVQRLLTPAQHHEIRVWIAAARTPEAIMQMPAGLWRSLELASVLMGVDADISQPLCFDGPG
jgi:hypothetical protein